MNAGFNAIGNPRAVGRDDADQPVFDLDRSNLQNPDDPTNSVDSAAGLAGADEITVFLPDGTFGVFFHFDDGAGLSGWADAGLSPAGNFVIENGTGFVLNRKSSGPFVWCVPPEPIATN